MTPIRHLKRSPFGDNALMIHDIVREHGSLAQLIAALTQDIIVFMGTEETVL